MIKKSILVVLIVLFTLTGCSNVASPEAYNQQIDAKKTLVIGEWLNLNVDGIEIKFRFDGFTPIQDKETFGKYVMMLCSIENVSNRDYEAYSFFEGVVKITDADGFLLAPSSYGWDYDVYDCDTTIKSGEKKRIVKAFAYDADVADLTLTISDKVDTYVYTDTNDTSENTTSNDTTLCEHVWVEATLADPSYCSICGEENLFGWSISTGYIMGTWVAEYYYSEGEVISGSAVEFEARFVTDGTGYIKSDGKKYKITWSFSQEVDDLIIYKVVMAGDVRQIGYVTDVGNKFYHKLMFELEDDDLYVILKKKV